MAIPVTFHIIAEALESEASQDKAQQQAALAHNLLACELAASCYRNNQRVFIYTDDQQTAHQIDELLWSFAPQSFVPHNLPGEGLRGGSAVEVSWQPPTTKRPILINLAKQVPNFFGQFSQIFDFVPEQDELKQLARTRYRQYQQLGCKLSTRSSTQAA